MLNDKCVVVGISGSIAAYKTATLVSMLVKSGCEVHVIMTKSGTEFISPVTFESLTGNKCYVDTFDRDFEFDVKHVSLAKKADLIIVAPASANTIAKISCGIADNMLTDVILASSAKKLIAPAMNTGMYLNPITQENIARLRKFGFEIIEPGSGHLACGDEGQGKMEESEVLFRYIEKEISRDKDLAGKNVLVTAGPTREAIDPVRFITNHSSGKMGFAIAKAAMLRGAHVRLIMGNTNVEPPMFVDITKVDDASQMYDAVMEYFPDADYVFKAAAVSDYTPCEKADNKIKKKDGEMSIEMKRTKDILSELGRQKKDGQIVCGFSMETEDLLKNSKAKLDKKNADMIIANSLKDEGSGFAGDTNKITIITRDNIEEMPLMSKSEAADIIIDAAKKMHG